MTKILAGIAIAVLVIFGLASSHAAGAASGDNQPVRPKITGIDHVVIYVSDVPRSRAFYSDVLGLPKESGDWSGKRLARLGVNAEQFVELEAVPSPAPRNWVAEVVFATDDAVALRKYLTARAVSAEPISKEGPAPDLEVRDPEGNRIGFVQRSGAAAPFKAAEKQLGSRMIHAGFVVKSIDAENRFYRDVIGFRVYWYGGFKDNDIDWYEIQVPDGGDWIEYMLNIPANADHKELGVQNHFSLGVKDAGVAAAELKKRGWKTFDGPEVGRDGKNSIDAYDPDGTRVEVMEFTPRQTPCCHAYEAAHPTP